MTTHNGADVEISQKQSMLGTIVESSKPVEDSRKEDTTAFTSKGLEQTGVLETPSKMPISLGVDISSQRDFDDDEEEPD